MKVIRDAHNVRGKAHLPATAADLTRTGQIAAAWCGRAVRNAEVVDRTVCDPYDRCTRCEREAALRATTEAGA